MNKHFRSITLILVLTVLLSACQGVSLNSNGTEIEASGTISAKQVKVAPELGGKVAEVMVEEGGSVEAGDTLFRLDDALLLVQRVQASAAVSAAEAAVDTARAGLESARIQNDLTLNAARLQDQQNRATAWQAPLPEEFSLPVWYYDKAEAVSAAKAEVADARSALDAEQANLQRLLESAAHKDFSDTERRMGKAQATFLIAQQILDRAKAQTAENEASLESYAQKQFDAARDELNALLSTYNRMLTTQAATDILEARGRVAVASARYETALDRLDQMFTGDQSLQVKAAEAGVAQAEAALAQAEAARVQAQSAVEAIDTQLAKIAVKAPESGVVLARNVEPGEVVSPGSTVMVIGQLAEVMLTVYIPETRYGRVALGDKANITVDSFPGQTFTGTVIHISDQAEFTPRNVQTIEGRSATVYAIKLSVPNSDLKLKPGMPATVVFP